MTQELQNKLPIGVMQYGLREGLTAGNITAGTSALPIPATPLTDRKTIMVRNDSGQIAYLGASNVTSGGSNGMVFKNGETMCLDLDARTILYVVLSSGAGAIYYMEGS